MIRICGKSICKALQLIFNQCITLVNVKNNLSVLSLPICEKILEKLIFNEMLRFLIENNLISSNQSGFKAGDPCINLLLSITHEIYTPCDDGFEVICVFFLISLKFLIEFGARLLSSNYNKMKFLSNSSVLSNFLKNRKQRVTLNGEVSFLTGVNTGVPHRINSGSFPFFRFISTI